MEGFSNQQSYMSYIFWNAHQIRTIPISNHVTCILRCLNTTSYNYFGVNKVGALLVHVHVDVFDTPTQKFDQWLIPGPALPPPA